MTKLVADTSAVLTSEDTLVLASMGSPVEMQLIMDWLGEQRARTPGAKFDVLKLPPRNAPTAALTALVEQLESGSEAGADRSIVPVQVFWQPPADRSRLAKVAGLLPGRDPYHPNPRQQRRILRSDPQRARVMAGESATVSELRKQWRDSTVGEDQHDFAHFVARRAILALARAEYRILGPQYKSPRLVKPEMLASARFRAGLEKIPGATVEEAGKMLDELATGWGQASVDVFSVLGRLISRGFDPEFDYDEYQVAAMRTALEAHPAVLLFSHRSYIDGAVVPVAMQDNRLPPVHMFGGVNLSFGVMGPLMRRAGMIFIRRNIAGDDSLYKYVLKEYVGYVVEKRFNLSWSIEGTRSRTGKMLPPKLGLMSYVADAYLDGRSDDILLQGVSICFDQLHEIAEYAAYARGAEKTPEGFSWLYNFIKAQGERNYGKIYVRFPEAVSMRQYLGVPHGPITHDLAAKRLALQKMSFEVAWRILRATPMTATGLVCALLLTARGTALTLGQLHHTLQDSLDYLERKQTPMSTSALRLRSREGGPGGRGRPVQRAPGHPGGQRPRTGLVHRSRGRTRRGLLPEFGDPRLPGNLDRGACAGPCPPRRRRSHGRLLGPGDAVAGSAEIRLLLRRLGGISRQHRRRDGVAPGLGKPGRRRGRSDRRNPLCKATADFGRHAAGVLRGLRNRCRRAARCSGEHQTEGPDGLGAGPRAPIRGPGAGPQQRAGVNTALRNRTSGGRRPAPDRARARPDRASERVPGRIAQYPA